MATESTRPTDAGDGPTMSRSGSCSTSTASSEPNAPPAVPPANVEGPVGRYELLDEIARGGMGAVVRANDRTLGREVAVKVLQERFAAASLVARRFLDEARIAGQLQHPGIPPVHDLGTLPDGRPFLAMKLIKGRTLEALLRDRPDPAADRGRFLAAFEQVCQAVAYAHSRRVIHRDLKPANVMVGAFGEVQVMDWGLAKVLSDRPVPAPVAAGDSGERLATEIRSGRDTEGSETQAGSVLGTPAYMAPEQAVGAVDQVDARSDVFGLGAILAVILTGRPPFVGADAESVRVLAARGKVEECFTRLDASGADPELVALCKRCLSPERDDRPADAGAVAASVAGLRAEAEERARQAELDRVRAEGERARAEAEARAQKQKRRTQLAAAAGLLGLLVVGTGGWLAVRGQAAARDADADRVASVALGRADQLASQAGAIDADEVAQANEAVRLWEEAESAMKQAEEALAGAGDADLRTRVKDRAASVRSGLDHARRDANLLAALEAAEGADIGTVRNVGDGRQRVRMYRAAFAAAGLPAEGDAAALAAAVRAERPGLRLALSRALIIWASALKSQPGPNVDRPPDQDYDRVRAASELANTDPILKEIDAAREAGDKAALSRLGDRDLDPLGADHLVSVLVSKGMASDAVRILRRARDRYPSDLIVLFGLSKVLWVASPEDPVAIEEAIGALRAAVAVSPNRAHTYYQLGQVYFFLRKDLPAAERYYLRTLELNPRFTFAMINLGSIQQTRRDPTAAERWYRRASETDPQFSMPHVGLGRLLVDRGDLAGAEAEYRKWIDLEPKQPDAHLFLGEVLMWRGDRAGAEAEFRKFADLEQNSTRAQPLLASFQRKAALLPRLDDVVAGRTAPASPAEALAFADLCYQPFRRQYAAAARLFDRAFAADPKLAEVLATSNRYNAACSATLAGCGQGTDAPAEPGARANLRGKALGWLRADLAAWAKQADSDKPADRKKGAAMLAHWLEDSDLAGVRPGPGRIDLPANERSAWDALWAEVRATLTRAQAQKPATTPPATPKAAKSAAPGG